MCAATAWLADILNDFEALRSLYRDAPHGVSDNAAIAMGEPALFTRPAGMFDTAFSPRSASQSKIKKEGAKPEWLRPFVSFRRLISLETSALLPVPEDQNRLMTGALLSAPV